MSAMDDITQLLRRWREGDAEAGARVVALTYDDLRRVARAHLRDERFAQSLGATGLLHEAYLRLLRHGPGTVDGREAFFRVMAAEMRRRLIDRARRRLAAKRGAGARLELLDEVVTPPAVDEGSRDEVDFARLDRALETLIQKEPRAARVVQLRFLAGMTTEDVAVELGVSPGTVKRDWTFARAWLAASLRSARDAN